MIARRYLPGMTTTEEDIAHWTARVAKLERQLDAATKLADVKAIAGELHRTRAALTRARAGRAGLRPKHGKSRSSGRRSASTATEPANS